jgi:hypothetical protein
MTKNLTYQPKPQVHTCNLTHFITPRSKPKMASFSGQNDLLELNEPGFDFSVQFEQLFFSIIPSVLFIAFSLWRSLSQARKPTVIEAPVFQLIKLVRIRKLILSDTILTAP